MTSPATIALEFAQEVIGWDDVREDGIGLYVFSHPDRPKKLLHYRDLHAVLAVVRGWCDEHEGAIEIRYFGYVPGEWEADVSTPHGIESITCNDLCHALMAACLMASRKLKAAR